MCIRDRHPAERQIIGGGAHQTAAAGQERRRLEIRAGRRIVLQCLAALAVGRIAGRKTAGLGGGHMKARIRHSQRVENPLLQKLIERNAADLANEIAEHIGRDGVVPGLARRKLERNLAEIIDHGLQRAAGLQLTDFCRAICSIDVGSVLEAVGQTRRVAQQIDDLHRACRRLGEERRSPARNRAEQRHAAVEHAQCLPLGNILVNRFVQRDAAFLDQHHERYRRDRLGHRVDAEDRVVFGRNVALHVGEPLHGRMGDLAAPIDEGLRAGEPARIDILPLQMIFEAAKSRRRHANGFGRPGRRGKRLRRH